MAKLEITYSHDWGIKIFNNNKKARFIDSDEEVLKVITINQAIEEVLRLAENIEDCYAPNIDARIPYLDDLENHGNDLGILTFNDEYCCYVFILVEV